MQNINQFLVQREYEEPLNDRHIHMHVLKPRNFAHRNQRNCSVFIYRATRHDKICQSPGYETFFNSRIFYFVTALKVTVDVKMMLVVFANNVKIRFVSL